ncbi:hypothetical protein [Falsiphaeobacter marinintestinus]|uniref:hypothetical protein n=1 Tax=Falsiphaeobacter marinintestinus TaxID=1492905 RepID=UPI0011B5E749|nr:hypothetical protein [Phaeobacter marinintestinus]
MRKAVFALSLAYVILFGWAWFDTLNASMDAAGRGMALGFLTIGMGVTAVCVVPAVILAVMDKAPKWALGLALTPAALMVFATLSSVV